MTPLLADENFSLRVVMVLRAAGYDVVTANQAGIADRGTDDVDVLRFATERGRAVVTYDRHDYARLHRRGVEHAGILICRDQRDVAALAERIAAALTAAEPIAGKLVILREQVWTIEDRREARR